jgi:hypothetical protein
MCEPFEISNADHPLFRELRNGFLWHCTSPKELLQIRTCGFIKPNNRQIGKYGDSLSACQELNGVSLFDFTTASEEQVLGCAAKWDHFLGCARPLTIIIGFIKDKLLGKLISYPENRNLSSEKSSDPIPWVEVCHCGQIPVSAITCYLLVCATDYNQFMKFENLGESDMTNAETMCAKISETQSKERAKKFEKLNRVMHSPEFKAQMDRADQIVRSGKMNPL